MTDRALQELLDKQALYELVCRVSRATDRADIELMRSLYHPDAIDDHGPFVGTIDEFIEARRDTLFNPEKRPNPVQHAITNALFEIHGDIAYGECYAEARRVDDGELWIEGIARYIDRFERRDGEWRIARRRIVLEYAGKGYDTSDFTRSYRDRRDPSYERDSAHRSTEQQQ